MTSHLIENEVDEDGMISYSLVFADREHITEQLRMIEPGRGEGFCDSTFKAVPKAVMTSKVKSHQLLVFQLNRRNHATVLFYALMERKRTEDYQRLFEYVFNTFVPEMKGKLGKSHMDFELAEAIALKSVRPGIKVVPCIFHYTQAQWKNARKKGALIRKRKYGKKVELTKEEEEISKEIDEFLRLISKIPYLEAKHIDESLVDFFVAALSEKAQEKLSDYIVYYKKQWLNDCNPTEWSIHGEVTGQKLRNYTAVVGNKTYVARLRGALDRVAV